MNVTATRGSFLSTRRVKLNVGFVPRADIATGTLNPLNFNRLLQLGNKVVYRKSRASANAVNLNIQVAAEIHTDTSNETLRLYFIFNKCGFTQ